MSFSIDKYARHVNSPSEVRGYTAKAAHTIEAFRGSVNKRTNRLALGDTLLGKKELDISWLPAAAESYKISADPRDYVIIDIPIVTVDIPNRNMQAFPYEEISYFDPLYGRMVYQTFVGKPTHIDHQNKDPLKAKGVHFDSSVQYVPAFNVWKIRVLAGFDRTKDAHLVNQILRKQRTGYSMGALVENFVCSGCGQIETNIKPCHCMKTVGKGGILRTKDAQGNKVNSLIYQMCVGCNYIETSSVEDPADITADTEAFWE